MPHHSPHTPAILARARRCQTMRTTALKQRPLASPGPVNTEHDLSQLNSLLPPDQIKLKIK
eukprot:11173204-Lingulodinium_polyedra.AAC.1